MSDNRIVLAAISVAAATMAAGAASTGPARAEEKAPNFNKLNDALELRLPSTSRSRSFGNTESAPVTSPAPARREDFHWVKPKGKATQPGTGNRSEAAPAAETASIAVGGAGKTRFLAAGAIGFAKSSPDATRMVQAAPPADAPSTDIPAAAPAPPAAVPVVRKNSYVILIKPDILRKSDGGANDVIQLLEKYGLEPVRTRHHRSVVAPSGRIVVQQSEETLESATSSVQPEPTGKPEIDVRKQLEPDIIRKLRKEGIVDDAYVNSTIRNNTLPHPVRTRTRAHGKVFGWIWGEPSAVADSPPAETTPAETAGPETVVPQPAADNTTTMPLMQPAAETVDDGNWGLKAIRVPAMWTVIKRFRAAHDGATARPKIAVIDQGFNSHTGLGYSIVDPPSIAASKGEPCEIAHGTHVAGIIAATTKTDMGIDGIVPEAKIDAVPFQLDYALEDPGAEVQEWMRRWVLFADVMNDTEDYVVREQGSGNPLRVINLSLAYNLGGLFTKDPGTVPELVRHIQAQAKDVQRTVRRYEDQILFVVAAGNDSQDRPKPLDARWASPLAWAGTQPWTTAPPSPNIIVVEALDRSGKRAAFSNAGGHVAAPGVNIMSTLGPGDNVFGVCSGTSQAAPHVAAVATLLFELDPKRKPKEIAEILRKSAVAAADPAAAPRVDALEAVLRVYPDGVRVLADLDRDGVVDEADLAILLQQLDEIYDNRLNASAFSADLNEDGVVDNNECLFPVADLNGSGRLSLDGTDTRVILGARRSDLDVLQLAWSKGAEDFARATALTPIADAMGAPLETGTVAAVSPEKMASAAASCR